MHIKDALYLYNSVYSVDSYSGKIHIEQVSSLCSAILSFLGYKSAVIALVTSETQPLPMQTLCQFFVENTEYEYLRFAICETLPTLAPYT